MGRGEACPDGDKSGEERYVGVVRGEPRPQERFRSMDERALWRSEGRGDVMARW